MVWQTRIVFLSLHTFIAYTSPDFLTHNNLCFLFLLKKYQSGMHVLPDKLMMLDAFQRHVLHTVDYNLPFSASQIYRMGNRENIASNLFRAMWHWCTECGNFWGIFCAYDSRFLYMYTFASKTANDHNQKKKLFFFW